MLKQIQFEKPWISLLSRNWPTALFCLAHIVIYLVIFQGDLYGNFLREDFSLDYLYSYRTLHGYLPYRDIPVEYPPMAMLFIILPGLFSPVLSGYVWAYAVQLLIFDLAAIFLIRSLAKCFLLNEWKTLGIYTLSILAVGPLITFRFDLIPAVFTLLAVYLLLKNHSGTAWIFLAIAVLTKIYPAVLAPIFLIYQLHQHRKREALLGIASFAITGMVIILPALILSPEGLWHSFTYHTGRGLQIESTYASILELLYAFKLIILDFSFSSGSVNVVSPAADIIAKLSFPIMCIGLLVVYWQFYKRLKNIPQSGGNTSVQDPEPSVLLSFSLLIILVFILTSKVFSPQYIIWILPFIPLVTGKWRNVSWLLFIMIGLMTFFIYPKYYAGIEHGELITVAMLFLRNAALVTMAVMVAGSGLLKGAKHSLSG